MTSYRHAETVMGTVVSFELRGQGPARAAADAIGAAVRWLHWVDATFSTYKPDSNVNRLDRGELVVAACDPQVREILDLCDILHAATEGYFDARATGHLDPSGVVKGWSIERASMLLHDLGWPNHSIDGGGDVRLRGDAGLVQGWQVAITHPFRLDAFCAVVAVTEGAVATSGTYQRGFHVLDPHRGQPATALAAVTVIGRELVWSDAYATAALAMGTNAPTWLEALPDHEAYVIDAEGHSWRSSGFDRYLIS
jgi:thiamine biosynthesis lipoprotein